MQTEHIKVLNVKCAGCVTNIQNGLAELSGVGGVEISIDSGEVTVKGEGLDRSQLTHKLSELGYPES